MGTQAKTMTGARAKLYVDGNLVGSFSTCSYGVNYGVSPISILGRANTAELVYTGMDPVSVEVQGFRFINMDQSGKFLDDKGSPHGASALPKLQELLTHQDISLTIVDRITGKEIMTVLDVRPESFSTDIRAKDVASLSIRFIGIKYEDESGSQEDVGGVTYG